MLLLLCLFFVFFFHVIFSTFLSSFFLPFGKAFLLSYLTTFLCVWKKRHLQPAFQYICIYIYILGNNKFYNVSSLIGKLNNIQYIEQVVASASLLTEDILKMWDTKDNIQYIYILIL
jgi:hypothetical protein